MENKHIKTINGKKYFYRSIRKGKKVTSQYIGPVDESKEQKNKERQKINKEDIIQKEDNYIC